MAIEVYPVVHLVRGQDAAKISTEQVQIAADLGAQGVYLIDHYSTSVDILLQSFNAASDAEPDYFIGLNFLQHASSFEGFRQLLDWREADLVEKLPSGLWVDAAHNLLEKTVELRESNRELLDVRYLGGVAFKYTSRYTSDPLVAATEARLFAPYVDVVTTSGAGTGQPANPDKTAKMKQAIGDQPLALASGVDANNIHSYNDVDMVLVSTSIETYPQSGQFNASALKELIDAAGSL